MYSLKDTVGYITPAPVAWGAYSMEPDVYFLLCTFQHMEDTLPPPGVFAPEVAKLHRSSQLNGQPPQKFGKQLGSRTFHGNVRISHAFVDTWEEYFIKTTRTLLRQEKHAQGPNEEIERMAEPFFEKVIPRLLRPLQTGGRSIAPCIIHGDLWHGNVGTDKKTGRPVIFDPACFYAHNEYELGVWSQPWNKINNTYREEYHKHFPPSEPVEDCDDRSALYGVRVNILDSILYKDDKTYRTRLIAGMRELVDKFPGGFEEWEASPGASKA
ncbi:Fructosamine/Ketosamine-3-kinase [Hypoxylon sp. FL1150]|nr:Fructosamine/Ketosamine-3-kinase [Hypoxylon sp. FL1150]